MRALSVLLLVSLSACGSRTSLQVEAPDASSERDGGLPSRDAGPDSGRDGGPRDAGLLTDAGPREPRRTLTAGAWTTCASDLEGAFRCWGRNTGGQIGDGTTLDRHAPVPLANGLERELVQVSLGSGYACGVDRSGDVWCWGARIGNYVLFATFPGDAMQIPDVSGAVYVEAGQTTACALHADGGVSCWGSTYRQRGGECALRAPRQPSRVEGAEGAVQIGVGAGSHCLRRGDGTVHCWGCNAHGQLGVGDMGGTFERPRQVEGISRVVDLSVGWNHSCVVQADGQSFCWGAATAGALGNGETRGSFSTPQRTSLARADAIFAGNSSMTCATVDGAVQCVGGLPVSSTAGGCSGRASAAWQLQPGLPDVEDMSLSFGSDICARSAGDGSIWCWGCNAFGGVGDGTDAFVEVPLQVLP